MSLSFKSSAAHSDKYRPDVDGLRALAVVPVILFHAKVPGFSGGFVGVDIFYVISGYLITSLVLTEVVQDRFSFVSFYERRVRRIFPALFAVVFFCLLAAGVLFTPRHFRAFGESMAAVTFFASNIFFQRFGDGYFDHTAEISPLQHTWSLSVEEQFYLFLPGMLILLFRWSKGRMVTWSVVLAGVSFLVSVWMTHYRPTAAFYLLLPRAWELLLGALLALKAVPVLSNRLLREIAGAVGLGLLAWAIHSFSKDTPFPGARALVPCLGAGLVIYAGEETSSRLRAALSWGPLVLIGAISYSLYLWHWPLIVFARYLAAHDLSGTQTAVIIGASFGMALLSFQFIEKPFRGSGSRMSRSQVFKFGAAASALCGALGFLILVNKGLPGRYSAATRQVLLENEMREDDFWDDSRNWKKDVRSVDDIAFTHLGPTSGENIMFWGDSHVQQLYPLIVKMNDHGDLQPYSVLMAIANGCPPVEHMNGILPDIHCDRFTTLAMQRAQQPDIRVVFIGFNTWWSVYEFLCPSVDGRCVGRLSPEEASERFLDELSVRIQALRALGKRVIVSLPFPIFDKSIPQLQIRNVLFGRFGLAGVANDITLPRFRAAIAGVATEAGADIFDPRKSLCRGDSCLTAVNGVSIYKDYEHIAASQIQVVEDDFRRVLQLAQPSASGPGRPNDAERSLATVRAP